VGIQFGGAKARKTGVLKGIFYALQYVNGEPSLVLGLPNSIRNTLGHAGAYVIPVDAAYRYSADSSKALAENFENFVRIAAVIGLDPTSRLDVRNIIDACQTLLDDLVKMPPEPESLVDRAVAQELADVRVDGNAVHLELVH
jgi:hypothetical protein